MVYLFCFIIYTGKETLFHPLGQMKLEERFSLVIMIELIVIHFLLLPSLWIQQREGFLKQMNEISSKKIQNGLLRFRCMNCVWNGWKWFSGVDWKLQAFNSSTVPYLDREINRNIFAVEENSFFTFLFHLVPNVRKVIKF